MISLINLFLESRAISAEFGGISRCAPAYEQDWELIVAISTAAKDPLRGTCSLATIPRPNPTS
jgi:hypothetical protein